MFAFLHTPVRRSALFGVCLVLHSGAVVAQNQCTGDAMLVFDASRSMINPSDENNGRPRIVEARDALRRVLPQVTPFRNLGLVVYGPGRQNVCGSIEVRMLPSPDATGPIMAEINTIEPDGDTPLTQAVAQAAEVLREHTDAGAVVLITDGRETCGGAPCLLAEELARTTPNLVVHVIGFKTQISSFEWQSFGDKDGQNTQLIARCLAERTGGTYATAQSTDELVRALQEVLGCPVISVRRYINWAF